MTAHRWKHLNHLQVGKYAEHLVKMELTRLGCDVYSAEVDDKGIDFVLRTCTRRYLDVQVKALRGLGYTYLKKHGQELRPDLLVALVLLREEEAPAVFLIPSTELNRRDALFGGSDFVGKKSRPEWGIRVSKKSLPLLEPFRLDAVQESLR